MRGVDKALIEQVEAELCAVQAIPVPVAAATYVGDGVGWHGVGEPVVPGVNADPSVIPPEGCHPDPVVVAPTPVGTLPTLEDEAYMTTLSPAPIVPLPPVPPVTTALPMTFAQLMQHITPLLVSGKLTQPKLQGVVESCGLPHLAALGARPDLVETVRNAIDLEMTRGL